MHKLLTVAAVGLSLALTPGTASADFIDFTVDEGGVPAALDLAHTVDKINGGYTEVITFDGVNFLTSAYANFGQYFANNGSLLVATQLNNLGSNGYGLYALFTASGSVAGGSLVGNSADVTFWLDPDQNTDFTSALGTAGDTPTPSGTADDLLLMSESDLTFGVGIPGDPGAFEFRFFGPITESPDGDNYWPDLETLAIAMTVDGDFDEFDFVGTQTVTGDLSVVFVPEPASLSLLGVGLLGVGFALRRKAHASV